MTAGGAVSGVVFLRVARFLTGLGASPTGAAVMVVAADLATRFLRGAGVFSEGDGVMGLGIEKNV